MLLARLFQVISVLLVGLYSHVSCMLLIMYCQSVSSWLALGYSETYIIIIYGRDPNFRTQQCLAGVLISQLNNVIWLLSIVTVHSNLTQFKINFWSNVWIHVHFHRYTSWGLRWGRFWGRNWPRRPTEVRGCIRSSCAMVSRTLQHSDKPKRRRCEL